MLTKTIFRTVLGLTLCAAAAPGLSAMQTINSVTCDRGACARPLELVNGESVTISLSGQGLAALTAGVVTDRSGRPIQGVNVALGDLPSAVRARSLTTTRDVTLTARGVGTLSDLQLRFTTSRRGSVTAPLELTVAAATTADVETAVSTLWYDSPISGIYSEKASYGGQPGIGHPRFATRAAGGDLVIAVSGLHGKNPRPIRVALLDADQIMMKSGGTWPAAPCDMAGVLAGAPTAVLVHVATDPPELIRILGVPAGTSVVVVTGFEFFMGAESPPPGQAMVVNYSQLSDAVIGAVPQAPLSAGGTRVRLRAPDSCSE